MNKKKIASIIDKSNFTGLLVSAGLSSRMKNFKPLLEYEGKSFLINVIDKLLLVCKNVVIVTGHNSTAIENELSINDTKYFGRVKCIFNSEYEKGMFTSIKKGANEIKNAEWVLYHQIDQPNLPQEFYIKFISEIENIYDWIQPIQNERKGHPILFNKKIINIIINSKPDSNLRLLSKFNTIKKKYWKCTYKEIFSDIDTLNDFNKLKMSEK